MLPSQQKKNLQIIRKENFSQLQFLSRHDTNDVNLNNQLSICDFAVCFVLVFPV